MDRQPRHRWIPAGSSLESGCRWCGSRCRPQNELKTGGPGLFEVLYADPERLREFLTAMSGISRGSNQTIARTFPWRNHRTFVDVGTAQGDLAVQIALVHPRLSGCGFDYTGADWMGWMREAGFSSTRVEPLVGSDSMVIGIR